MLHTCSGEPARYCFLMFWLTRREQALVAFVLLAFLAGLGVKHWRDAQPPGKWQKFEQARMEF